MKREKETPSFFERKKQRNVLKIIITISVSSSLPSLREGRRFFLPSQHQVILRQLRKRRKRLGNALERVVDEFSAFVLAADDSAALAKNVFFVVDDCGVLAEFADAGQIAGNIVFHDNILYGSVILCFAEIYYTAYTVKFQEPCANPS